MNVIPLRPFGAEIGGVDLREPLPRSTFAAIEAALRTHRVVVFPAQRLDDAQHTAFASGFGALEAVTTSGSRDAAAPHILWVSNVRAAGLHTVLEDGPMGLHIDGCYRARPVRYTMLHALEVPDHGGETLIVDAVRAWATLAEPLRTVLEPRRALHVYDYAQNGLLRRSASAPGAPRAWHPAVRTHGLDGEKSLFLCPLMTEALEGLSHDQSAAVLAQVFRHLEDPALCYAHRWRAGDLLVWDNLRALHGRRDFDPGARRVMRRMAVSAN